MCPICAITYGGGSPSANRIDANVRRSECGVSPAGIVDVLARSRSHRPRALVGLSRSPSRAPAGGRCSRRAASGRRREHERRLVDASLHAAKRAGARRRAPAGCSPSRAPAAVLPARTVIVPRARSRSRHRNASASPIRSPANTSVATSARRCPFARASLSSAPAPSNSAATCSARSSQVRVGARAGTSAGGGRRDVARDHSYSTARSRIAASSASVLLIDVAFSFPACTLPVRKRSTSSTVISSSRFAANAGHKCFSLQCRSAFPARLPSSRCPRGRLRSAGVSTTRSRTR